MLSIKYIKLPMSIFSSTLWFIISLLQHCLYTFSNSSSILTISLWYHFLFNWENRRKWKKVSASPLIASTPLLAFAALFSDSSPVIVSQWQSAHPLHSRCPALLPTQVHCSATLFTPSIINHFFLSWVIPSMWTNCLFFLKNKTYKQNTSWDNTSHSYVHFPSCWSDCLCLERIVSAHCLKPLPMSILS